MDDAKVEPGQDIGTATGNDLTVRGFSRLQFHDFARLNRDERRDTLIPATMRVFLCESVFDVHGHTMAPILLFFEINLTTPRHGLRNAEGQHYNDNDAENKPRRTERAGQVIWCGWQGNKLEVQHDGKHDERMAGTMMCQPILNSPRCSRR